MLAKAYHGQPANTKDQEEASKSGGQAKVANVQDQERVIVIIKHEMDSRSKCQG